MRNYQDGASRASLEDRVYQPLVRNALRSSPALGHHGPLDVPAAWRRSLGASSIASLGSVGRGHIRTFAVPLAGHTQRPPRGQSVLDFTAGNPPIPRADCPSPVSKRPRGNAALAKDTLRNTSVREEAVTELIADFYANSSRQPVSSKRSFVMELAELACGSVSPLPLVRGTVFGVAAALKKGGYKSADSYLRELRLLHVEAGYNIDAALARCFEQCQRSVTRGIGPPAKANEMWDVQVAWELLDREANEVGSLRDSDRAWVVATRFLLREIELGHIRIGHVKLDRSLVQVALFLPTSKMDSRGAGCKRTLT